VEGHRPARLIFIKLVYILSCAHAFSFTVSPYLSGTLVTTRL